MKRLYLIFGFIFLLFGCSLFEGNNAVPPGKSRVSFVLPEASDTDSPNELIYINLNSDNPVLRHVSLEDGYNEIDLDKNGTHLLGLISNSGTARSIGSTISTLGNIGIISNGLDSLPLSDDASDNIDLGDLTDSDETFESVINSTTISDNTGYSKDTLSGFGQFDETTMKFLNPDINQNGIYDSEEGIQWSFQVNYNIELTVTSADFDNDVIETSVSSINPSISYQLFHNGSLDPDDNFDYQGTNVNDNIRLYFPETSNIVDNYSNPITYRASYYTDQNQFAFDTYPGGMNPLPPYDGDYVIQVYDKNYYLDNIKFLKPANGYENMIVIIYKQNIDGNGNVISVSWKWKVITAGQYEDIDPNVVKLRVKNLDIKWSYPGGAFNPNWHDGTEYYTSIDTYWINGTFTPPAGTNAYNKELVCTFSDSAGNGFWFGQTNNITTEQK